MYLIARCIDETTRRESTFRDDKTGKDVHRVTYVTGYRCDGATFEHTAYADVTSEKPVTDRGEPIELVPFGARVLFSKSTYAKDDKTGQKLVQRINGKVLDVQASKI
ncbi:MAG: hypothetical protein WC205_10980 [Opitutaceae bacterium]|jgi:hypothetical protein